MAASFGVMPRTYLFFVYIMASSSGTLYVGMTNNVAGRAQQHKIHIGSEFTRRYKVDRLVYFEEHTYVLNAIARETQVKKWRRAKKVELIESVNPTWRDLTTDIGGYRFLKQPKLEWRCLAALDMTKRGVWPRKRSLDP